MANLCKYDWTEQKQLFLETNWRTMEGKKLAEKLGVSIAVIYQKRQELFAELGIKKAFFYKGEDTITVLYEPPKKTNRPAAQYSNHSPYRIASKGNL